MWAYILLISVLLLTISAMYISAIDSCKDKPEDMGKLIVYNSASRKFGTILLVISVILTAACLIRIGVFFYSQGKM
jgi:hypothetical protein